jgi:hypothetical protein
VSEEVLKYGITETRQLTDEIDAHIEEIDHLGYTIVDSGLTGSDIDAIRQSIDSNYAAQKAETSHIAMKADADILRCPLAYDDIFLKVATVVPLMEICRRSFGENFVLLQQNGIINRPTTQEFQSRWHRDLAYQHFVTSKRLALNALLCVDDFTLETGGTLVLPGTHRIEEFPSSRFVNKHQTSVSAKAGSVLILDALLFHRSGLNISGRDRRGVNHLIGRPLLVPQIDLPRVLEGKHANDSFLQRYLGYQWNPASSVAAWRAARA